MNYILLVDEDEDILNVQTMLLSTFYSGEVKAVKNSIESIQILNDLGVPELIVSDQAILKEGDSSLYEHITRLDLLVPLIICSENVSCEFKQDQYPNVSVFLEKPFSVESLAYLVKSITCEPLSRPSFIAVKLPVLLNFIGESFDLYLKLSDTNFVKVIRQGELFTKEDSLKFMRKGVTHLWVSIMDSMDFLKSYEENLNLLLSSKSNQGEEQVIQVLDALVSIENVSKRFGWTKEVLQMAERSIGTAIKILSQETQVLNLLKAKLKNCSLDYNLHLSLVSYICCVFSSEYIWGGEGVQTKLVLAALLHDLAVDDKYYNDIKVWNSRAADLKDRAVDVVKYRLHPMEASKLIKSFKYVPADIEQILLQHHEKQDGTGFPRAITSSRITPLASFFIIVEDLVGFIGDGENLETSLIDFKMWGDANYDHGHFQKAYAIIRSKIG